MTGNIKSKPLKSYKSKCNEKNPYVNIFIVTVLLLALVITPLIFSGIINSKSDPLSLTKNSFKLNIGLSCSQLNRIQSHGQDSGKCGELRA